MMKNTDCKYSTLNDQRLEVYVSKYVAFVETFFVFIYKTKEMAIYFLLLLPAIMNQFWIKLIIFLSRYIYDQIYPYLYPKYILYLHFLANIISFK